MLKEDIIQIRDIEKCALDRITLANEESRDILIKTAEKCDFLVSEMKEEAKKEVSLIIKEAEAEGYKQAELAYKEAEKNREALKQKASKFIPEAVNLVKDTVINGD